jgi:hypothetical protein
MAQTEASPANALREEVSLNEIQPKFLGSKLPFQTNQCPLFISENGNATALYRYSSAGPFIELFDPSSDNLLPALKFSIIQGVFCIVNFGLIDNVDRISRLLEDFQKRCALIHRDLYGHIIHNTLMKQSFETLMSMIPFDPIYEMVPEIYRNSKPTFRFLFFVQVEDPSVQLPTAISSIFKCIRVKA